MIEVISQNGPASLAFGQESKMSMSREEHSLQEQTIRSKVPHRTPRRSQTTTHDYKLPTPSFQDIPETRTLVIRQMVPSSSSPDIQPNESTAHLASIPEEVPPPTTAPRRPRLPPPRRSYSCMDDEPLPAMNSPHSRLALCDLPGELHYNIFDFLDPIDSACLGLANKHYYAIHRRLHGSTPLSARRSGPNDMEWAWHIASRVVEKDRGANSTSSSKAKEPGKEGEVAAAVTLASPTSPTSPGVEGNLSRLRVKGQALCRKCGVSRCELYKHIAPWMGEGYEYCSVREKFGPAAAEGAKKDCYMANPADSSRCGRHRERR